MPFIKVLTSGCSASDDDYNFTMIELKPFTILESVQLFLKKVPDEKKVYTDILSIERLEELDATTKELEPDFEKVSKIAKVRAKYDTDNVQEYLEGHPMFTILQGKPLPLSMIAF